MGGGRGLSRIAGNSDRRPRPRKREPAVRLARVDLGSPNRGRRVPEPPLPKPRVVEILDQVEPRAKNYVSAADWQRVVSRARYRGCGTLATVARFMLHNRRLVHTVVGWLLGIPFSGPEREIARSLAERIPLGFDESVIAAARGLQLIGMFACVSNDRPLTRCACYLDVVEHDVAPMVRKLFAEATKDWTGLAELAEV